jgi:hypothetical protein
MVSGKPSAESDNLDAEESVDARRTIEEWRGIGDHQSIPNFFNLYRNARNVIPSFFAVAVLL